MKLNQRIFTFAALVVVLATAAYTQNPQKASVLDDLTFPEVEGWKRSAKTPLPTGEDGIVLDYSSTENERVTVYVYRRESEAKDLSGIVKEEFEGAVDAIRTVADAGIYSDLKVSKSSTSNIGGASGKTKALWTSITFTARNVPMNSEIYVFPYKGYVGKLRISRPVSVDKARNEPYARLLAAIDSVFTK